MDSKTPPAATDPTAAPPPGDPAEQAEDAPLGESGLKALQTERAARKAAETQLAALLAEVRQSEASALRAEVASAHRLPPALAGRLVGTTKEELTADAAALAAAIHPPTKELPKEHLMPGAAPSARAEPSAADVVDKVLSR
jgi:hypothetical protein